MSKSFFQTRFQWINNGSPRRCSGILFSTLWWTDWFCFQIKKLAQFAFFNISKKNKELTFTWTQSSAFETIQRPGQSCGLNGSWFSKATNSNSRSGYLYSCITISRCCNSGTDANRRPSATWESCRIGWTRSTRRYQVTSLDRKNIGHSQRRGWDNSGCRGGGFIRSSWSWSVDRKPRRLHWRYGRLFWFAFLGILLLT